MSNMTPRLLEQPADVTLINVSGNDIRMANDAVSHEQMYPAARPTIELYSSAEHTLNLREATVDFLTALKDLTSDREVQKRISDFLKVGRSLDELVSSPAAAASVLQAVNKPDEVIFEAEFGGRWYPVKMEAQLRRTMFGVFAVLSGKVMIWNYEHILAARITTDDFIVDGELKARSVREVLEANGVRVTTPEAIAEHQRRVALAGQLGTTPGTVIDITGNIAVMVPGFFGSTLELVEYGSEKRPERGIIEGELEGGRRDDVYNYDDDEVAASALPYVRVFLPKQKRYAYVELGDFKKHEFDTSMKDSIVLPAEMKSVMNAVFEAGAKNSFGDIFTGRHGGMVIMANGPSGVGKTLTAEVFAETAGRPLYVMEMGELGTNLANVEAALQRIFARAARWNAVLLFDEADIFLARRDNDLERSAIVGVFLRLLDYYEGMFFLTTNRGDVIDDAMKSRITLRLDYKELTDEARAAIWANNLKRGGFTLRSGSGFVEPTPELLAEVAKTQLNGRQIRNQIRLLSVLHPNRVVTLADIAAASKYVA